MPNVPERELSYGEVMDKMYKAHRRTAELKQSAKATRNRKPKAISRKQYSVSDVEEHIDEIRSQGDEYYKRLGYK